MLEHPDDTVTSSVRCLDIDKAKTCRYYVEKENEENKKEGLTKYNETEKQKISYLRINIIDDKELLKKIESTECSYFHFNIIEDGAIAYCGIMNRMLTTSQARNCILYARTCPIRKNA